MEQKMQKKTYQVVDENGNDVLVVTAVNGEQACFIAAGTAPEDALTFQAIEIEPMAELI
jgi:hypothetical protein